MSDSSVAAEGAPEVPEPAFSDLGLSESVLRGVSEAGYTRPTGIQAQAIPVILSTTCFASSMIVGNLPTEA